MMSENILDYIKTQRICVLAIEMLDGSPHAATVHFASNPDASMFFFMTSAGYRKAEPLIEREISRASVVLGVDEGNLRTFQLDGEVRLIVENEKEYFKEIYLSKFPEKERKFANEILFVFIPKWWRFSDWARPEGKLIIHSTDK